MHRYPRILSEAPVGRHFCQMHDRPDELTQAVADYARIGLLAGGAVIVAAEATRVAALRDALARHGLAVDKLERSRQQSLLDAHALLAQVAPGGRPNHARFREVVGELLGHVAAANHRHTRVYGEMVNLLWRDGAHDAALTLEAYWNELAFEHRFSLFYGYEIPGLDERAYDAPLPEIAHYHSDVLETDADGHLQHALDLASDEILGLPMSSALCYFGHAQHEAEHRLPAARRTILWLKRNMPAAVGKVLARARAHYTPA